MSKIKIYFRGKDIPNSIFNRYGQGFVEVESIRVVEGIVLIEDKHGLCTINLAIVSAVDSPVR
jgi:hypothetical protein